MAETATLGMLEEIRSLVSDRLQVISYKWLSRNFSVSSNAAKRLLEEFVEQHGDGLAVIYSLSGWLKNNPTTYHIRLVPSHMLSDAKEKFAGKCSVQVYSIQPCLPKDPAILWNHEFVQAEDLFKQPLTVDNCLRDNRFCGVSNSSVTRTVGGTPSIPQAIAAPQSIQKKFMNAGSNAVKTEGYVKPDLAQVSERDKVPRSLPNNKKGQNDQKSSGSGSSLASMWGRASAAPKPDACLVQADKARQGSSVSAEAQICARESAEHDISDDDDDGKAFSARRTSNGEGSRKRKVVFNYSDEEDEYENAINLGSPDPPKKSTLYSKESLNAFTTECNLSFGEKENKPKVQEEKKSDVKAKPKVKEEKERDVKGMPKVKEEKESHVKANQHLGEKVATASDVPKRRKVVKTRIDERGREVTEVVWEGEEQDTKSNNNSSAKIAGSNTVSNATNRPPVARKSPAVGNAAPANQPGKAGNKKAAAKDPKQGNLFSFFKKV
ncbi:uncharacterized protein LOC125201604 [Salvia hispanica]|uniref:uncharacterized protein LOC125201604 n=1 Tax=Salvia hispanica TaxID=49212 RepID=UPI002009B396|nr:uncharacterized protein LOC125201604 [Salvia hispanica]